MMFRIVLFPLLEIINSKRNHTLVNMFPVAFYWPFEGGDFDVFLTLCFWIFDVVFRIA